MIHARFNTLQTRLILLGTLSVAIALVTACVGFMWTDLRTLYEAKRRQLQAQAEIVGFNSAAVLLIGDAQAGRQLLAPLSTQPTIAAAALYADDGRLLTSFTAPGVAGPPPWAPRTVGHARTAGGELEYTQNVIEGGQSVGRLYLRANMRDLRQQTYEHLLVTLVVVIASSATALPLAILLARAVSRPILQLAESAEYISRQGDFTVRVAGGAAGEIGTLYRAFNEMLEHVDASDRALKASQDELEERVEIRTTELREQIRQRELVQQDLVAAKEAAEAASRAKSDFLANMSHEIRTPMNGVLGLTELVLESNLAPEQRESMELVKSSAESLMIVINDILDFSKIEAGKMDLDLSEFPLGEVVEEAARALALKAHTKSVELNCELSAYLPKCVIGDSGRLRQVLTNLVGNAIKFTERGEVNVHVLVAAELADAWQIRFAVTDTGIGIPRDKQQQIFAAFSQADTSTTRKYGGTGLGLTISARLVALMGGELLLDSEVGRGSTFYFTIQLGKAQVEGSSQTLTSPATLLGLDVLIIDDNATNRRILTGMLRQWGSFPTAVDGGPAALAELRRAADAGRPYALLLVDAMMPGMDGFTLIDEVRHHPELGHAVVMMLSSADSLGDAERCRKLGSAAYLVKPVRAVDLRTAIVAALRSGQQQSQASRTSPALPPTPSLAAAPARALNVLLAEDNPVNQRVAVSLLAKRGHTATVVANGREALAAVASEQFDLVLMDVQMPEIDGLEATRAIRAEESVTGRHLPIIAMTAHAMKGDRERCLAAGADDYVSKPVEIQLLFAAIDRVLRPGLESAGRRTTAPAPRSDEPLTAGGDATVCDLAALRVRVEGDAQLVAELIDLFLETSPELESDLGAAAAAGDMQALERAAHSLKGALRNLCAGPAAEAAAELEAIGRTGDLAAVPRALAAFTGEMARLRAALQASAVAP